MDILANEDRRPYGRRYSMKVFKLFKGFKNCRRRKISLVATPGVQRVELQTATTTGEHLIPENMKHRFKSKGHGPKLNKLRLEKIEIGKRKERGRQT